MNYHSSLLKCTRENASCNSMRKIKSFIWDEQSNVHYLSTSEETSIHERTCLFLYYSEYWFIKILLRKVRSKNLFLHWHFFRIRLFLFDVRVCDCSMQNKKNTKTEVIEGMRIIRRLKKTIESIFLRGLPTV